MALNESEAVALAHKILVGMAESGSLKTYGPMTGGVITVESNTKRGRLDAVYLATLYRDLVSELRK